MSTSNNNANKYDTFLDRLIKDVQSNDSDFRNLTKLHSLFDEYFDEINEALGTFLSFVNGLKTSTVILVYRLFDKSSISLYELIRLADVHGASINWIGNPL